MLHRGGTAAGQGETTTFPARIRARSRRCTGEGYRVGAANYKARMNLRVSLATAAKVRRIVTKGNKRQDQASALRPARACRLAGGSNGRT